MENSVAIGIVFKLMQGKRVKARELGEYFELSVRTVYRYIDILSASGIPIISFNGKNGGLEIDKSFKLNDNFLTTTETEYLINLLKNQEKNAKNTVLIEKFNKIL